MKRSEPNSGTFFSHSLYIPLEASVKISQSNSNTFRFLFAVFAQDEV